MFNVWDVGSMSGEKMLQDYNKGCELPPWVEIEESEFRENAYDAAKDPALRIWSDVSSSADVDGVNIPQN